MCHCVYRKTLMKPNTISIIPALGYNPEQITSVKAVQWLKYQSFALNIQICHAKSTHDDVDRVLDGTWHG